MQRIVCSRDRLAGGARTIGNQLPIVVGTALIGVAPVVFAYSLHQQELAFGWCFVRNAMRDFGQDLVSLSGGEIVPAVGTPRLDGEFTPQHEIMIRALAVIMPRNNIALLKPEDTYLNVAADHDWLDIFHLVVRLADREFIRDPPVLPSRLLWTELSGMQQATYFAHF